MPLTPEQKADLIQSGIGKVVELQTGPQLTSRIVEEALAKQSEPRGFSGETAQDIGQTIGGIGGAVSETVSDLGDIGADKKTGLLRKAFQGVGRVAGGISSVIGEGVKGAVKTILPKGAEESVRGGVRSIGEGIASVPAIQNLIQNYETLPPESKRDVDAFMGFAQLATDLIGFGVGKKAVTAAAPVVKSTVSRATQATKEAVGGATGKVSGLISPKPTVSRAIQTVIGGPKATTRNIREAGRAFNEVPITDAKSFADIGAKFSSRLDELNAIKTAELSKYPKPVKISRLSTTLGTGKDASRLNYPARAIKHLSELYKKTADQQGMADIKALVSKAKKTGLTPLEIEQLAQKYGSEFGSKAFSKANNEALTSVNSQMFENVRKGLKEVSRGFLKSDVAKQADRSMSAILNTKSLIQKQVERVGAMLGKTQEMGLLSKLGHYITSFMDNTRSVFQHGNLRGIVGGGSMEKSLNILDVERNLTKNLKIIENALKAKTGEELESFLKELNVPTTAK